MSWKVCIFGEWNGPFTLKRIEELTSVRPSLFLLAEGATDEELAELLKSPRIVGLAIVSPSITVAATRTLRAVPRLTELILCGPPITDDFLLHLSGIATLREITLVHTACTIDGVRRFLEAAPECTVFRGGTDSICPVSLRREVQLFVSGTVLRQAAGRRCENRDGVWTDVGIAADMPVVKIKPQSRTYLRMLERHPQMSEVFQLGRQVAWVTPSRTVLVIDPAAGEEQLSDMEIDRLFTIA
jgi:hypothetical protein